MKNNSRLKTIEDYHQALKKKYSEKSKAKKLVEFYEELKEFENILDYAKETLHRSSDNFYAWALLFHKSRKRIKSLFKFAKHL